MPLTGRRTKVFVSYSHKDGVWLEELRPHLGSLAREKGISSIFWDDTQIKPGSDWQGEIYDALTSAKVAVLLISKHFLNSDFITTNELPQMLAAAKTEAAVILPIVLSPCRYSYHPELSKFQSVNKLSEPLEGMSKVEYETLFLRVTELIDEAIASPGAEAKPEDPRAPDRVGPAPASRTSRTKTRPRAGSHTSPSPRAPAQRASRSGGKSWTKVVVQSLPDGSLQYQTIQNEVRFDCRLMPPQRRLVDDLATELSTSRTFDPELAAALFELLVPIELKSRLFDPEGTILVLDSTTARYPWELLQDGAAKGALPFAHRGSIVRQTVSDRLTPHQGLLAEARHHALVIGSPVDESFPPLPGARREAENVARALQRAGFEVTLQVEGRPLDAITALFSQPHRILHLAGHGVYEYELRDKTHVTGFVLGDGIFLTGAEVTAMRVAPEIVFLNAAYLGRHSMARSVDNPTGTDARPPASVRFAASLPDQLMTIGCRAVIAPADTVDDMAALTFATAFYEAMFTGHILGQAILSARRKTFEEHGHTNAWGTYLCYGDPDYRLADGNHAEAVAHLEDGSE